MTNVVTIKWGDKYPAGYVNKLARAVERNMTVKHSFICLTDDTDGIDKDVFTMPLMGDFRGWWNKMLLFRGLPGIHGLVVWIDLDTLILDNIDFLTEYKGPFAMLRDFYRPQFGASGLMLLQNGLNRWIWHRFEAKRTHFETNFHGDQEAVNVIMRTEGKEPHYLQDLFPEKIVSYKVDCQNKIPPGAAIMCFHGRPRPHEADHAWVRDYWR